MADNLRPSVREMDECSDFCSLRGVDAIDKSSCNMHEYTSSFNLKSGWAEVLKNQHTNTIIQKNLKETSSIVNFLSFQMKILQDESIGEGNVSCRAINGRDERCVHHFGANFGQTENGKASIVATIFEVVRIFPHERET